MTENPKPDSSELDEAEFDRVLRNLVNTPHKPHVSAPSRESGEASKKRGGPKTAPKSGS